jgi:predicted DNA binding CopG/RHH family protein
MKLNKYEQAIKKDISEYKSISGRKREQINNIITKVKEKKSVNLRVNIHDLNLLKQKAEQEGIPYQTLISSILHKYITDQLVDQKTILKNMQLLKNNG